MSWFPNNNHPLDKALYDFHITVPSTHVALGNGELASKVDNPNGTTTWNWHHAYPMATYLSTATVGLFDYVKTFGATALGAGGNPLELYNAIDSSYTADAEGHGQRDDRPRGRDREVPQRHLRDVPVRLGRRGRRSPLGRRLRARGADEGPLPDQQRQRQHDGARADAPVVRRQRVAEDVERHLAQRGLGDVVAVELDATSRTTATRRRQLFTNNYNSTQQPTRWNTPTAAADRGGPVQHVPRLHARRDDAGGAAPDPRRAGVLRARAHGG